MFTNWWQLMTIPTMFAQVPNHIMLERATRLEPTLLMACDIRALINNIKFQTIINCISQMLFLQQFASDECLVLINAKIFIVVY
jgi:hypothetical protein